MTVTGKRTVTLGGNNSLLDVASQTDTVTVNGRAYYPNLYRQNFDLQRDDSGGQEADRNPRQARADFRHANRSSVGYHLCL